MHYVIMCISNKAEALINFNKWYILSMMHQGADSDKRTQEVEFHVLFDEPQWNAVLCTVLETNASGKTPIKAALLLKSAPINPTVTYNTAVRPYSRREG